MMDDLNRLDSVNYKKINVFIFCQNVYERDWHNGKMLQL